MRARDLRSSHVLLAVGLALSMSATACGDDDDSSDAGEAGTGGKSGSGGAKAGTGGGGSVTPMKCESDTKTATLNAFPAACYKCLCTAPADIIALDKCTKNENCWPLLGCVTEMCPTEALDCITTKCMAFMPTMTPGALATPVADLFDEKCTAQCFPADSDGGAADAAN